MHPDPRQVNSYTWQIVHSHCAGWLREDQEDVVQDVMFKFYRAAPKTPMDCWQAYLRATAMTCIMDAMRKFKARRSLDVPLSETHYLEDPRFFDGWGDWLQGAFVAFSNLSETDQSIVADLMSGHRQIDVAKARSIHKSTVFRAKSHAKEAFAAAGLAQ